jgi:hypothetical protein
MEDSIKRFFLISAPAQALAGVDTSGLLMISSGVIDSVFTFLLWRSKPHPSESVLCTCLCITSKLDASSLVLLYLNGLELSLSLVAFLC